MGESFIHSSVFFFLWSKEPTIERCLNLLYSVFYKVLLEYIILAQSTKLCIFLRYIWYYWSQGYFLLSLILRCNEPGGIFISVILGRVFLNISAHVVQQLCLANIQILKYYHQKLIFSKIEWVYAIYTYIFSIKLQNTFIKVPFRYLLLFPDSPIPL